MFQTASSPSLVTIRIEYITGNQSTGFIFLVTLRLIIIMYKGRRNCEAQGKERAKGRLRKVTQRSFIDYRLVLY